METRIINGKTYWKGDVLYHTKAKAKENQKHFRQLGYYVVVIKVKNGYRLYTRERFRLVKKK